MEENKKEEEAKVEPVEKESYLGLIIVIVAVIMLGVGIGLLIVMPNENGFGKGSNTSSANTENSNQANGNSEKPVDNGTVKEIEIDDNIRELYEKYHSNINELVDGVRLTSLVIENEIYNSEKFEISELQNKSVLSYGYKIYESIKDELAEKAQYDDYNNRYFSANDSEEIIKNGFDNFFGYNLTFNHDIMSGCHVLHYNDGKYYYDPQCGDTSDIIAKFTISKAERDNNNIYIYEDVSLSSDIYDGENDSEEVTDNYTYKWTYALHEGNYYFVKAERINN